MSQGAMAGLLGRLKKNVEATTAPEVTAGDLPSWTKEKEPYAGAAKEPEPAAINPPETQTVAEAEAAKPVKEPKPAKKPKAPPVALAPEPTAPEGFTLYIDCAPVGETYETADKVYEQARRRVTEIHAVHDFRYVEYGKGAGSFAAACGEALDGRTFVGALVINTGTDEARVALGQFVQRAARVVRGTR